VDEPRPRPAEHRRPAPAWPITYPTAYPRIPSGPAPAPAPPPPRPGPRVGLVAALAGLLGVLAGSGLVLVGIDRLPTAPAPAAAPVAAVPQVRSPAVQVAGGEARDRVEAVAAAVLPSVVQIDVDGGVGLGGGNGSGVVYRSDGFILTNNHVVAESGELTVVFADGTTSGAEVVGTDRESDLAVLEVDRTDLVALAVGDPSGLAVGELAVAVGSPFGLDGSVTAGIVSAVDRSVSVRAPDGGGVSLLNAVQTDAPINPGNSGGPLVDGSAELIGINSAILTTGTSAGNAGVGFAIPASLAVDVAEELIATGEVRYAFLGVASIPVSPDVGERSGTARGAHVQTVEAGTPAADAGLRPDDVITRVGATVVDSPDALLGAIRDAEVGEVVVVAYRRDGREETVEVTLTERPG